MRREKNRRKKRITTTKVKNTKIKQRDYKSDGASATTNMYALKIERYKLIGKFVIEFIGIIGGIILIICNVRDEDFCLEFSNVKMKCSLAGLAIALISLYVMLKTNPVINIKNEKLL